MPLPEARIVPSLQAILNSGVPYDQALSSVEARRSISGTPAWTLKVAAWNVERCKNVEAAATILEAQDCDLILLTEMDCGMARSGNIHTTQILADRLGTDYAFGIEFIEFGHGNQTEIELFDGQENNTGLHGNAVLSRVALDGIWLLRLSGGELWSNLDWHSDRAGSRMAMFVTTKIAGRPFVVVNTHLESLPHPELRARQAREIIDTLDLHFAGLPALVAGDMNPAGLPEGAMDPAVHPDWFFEPQRHEPLFAEFAKAGFMWSSANTAQHTRRMLANGWPRPPFKKLDWFFTRGLAAADPLVVAACDADRSPISDHEMILTTVTAAS